MSLLFTQDWDVIRGKEDAYAEFVTQTFIPGCDKLGLRSVGGFYVQVGVGPKIISLKSATSLEHLQKAMADDGFKELKLRLRDFVINYSSKILEPTLALEEKDYEIQKGVWKYNIYYDVGPGVRKEYRRFLEDKYMSAVNGLDYVEITEVWNVLIGGFSESIIELTFKHPVDIGRIMDDVGFREVNYRLCRDYVRNYKSRILRTTERFDEPRWFRL